MTAPKTLGDKTLRKLLGDLTALKSDDDDALTQDPKWFLPLDGHARALRTETLVVRGGRGAGKSALFHALGYLKGHPAVAEALGASSISSTTWLEGFSIAVMHPSDAVVSSFGNGASEAERRSFWFGWLCVRLSTETKTPLPPGELQDAMSSGVVEPARLATAAGGQIATLSAWLDQIERGSHQTVSVTYDGLDRIGSSSSARTELTASLLAMWLSLADRYRTIRPKIFVREDLFQASLAKFPDASKLDARSVTLEWRVEDLYRVLIKHMANTSDELKVWVEGSTKGVPLTLRGSLGWMPPPLPEQGKVPSQKAFVDHLAGELMGTGAKKGLTFRWIPNRLQDAHSRIVPRSILNLIRNAAELSLQQGPQARNLRLLTPEELQGALTKTSLRRVNELKEEFPVVSRLENLRKKTVMLPRKAAVDALSTPRESADEFGEDGDQVLRTLIDLGVMSERPNGAIDVPDIYRYGFGILRKGGVKRPR